MKAEVDRLHLLRSTRESTSPTNISTFEEVTRDRRAEHPCAD
jgi:hypothetical protein